MFWEKRETKNLNTRVFHEKLTIYWNFQPKKRCLREKKYMILKDLETGYLPMYLSPFRNFWRKLTFLTGRGALKSTTSQFSSYKIQEFLILIYNYQLFFSFNHRNTYRIYNLFYLLPMTLLHKEMHDFFIIVWFLLKTSSVNINFIFEILFFIATRQKEKKLIKSFSFIQFSSKETMTFKKKRHSRARKTFIMHHNRI